MANLWWPLVKENQSEQRKFTCNSALDKLLTGSKTSFLVFKRVVKSPIPFLDPPFQDSVHEEQEKGGRVGLWILELWDPIGQRDYKKYMWARVGQVWQQYPTQQKNLAWCIAKTLVWILHNENVDFAQWKLRNLAERNELQRAVFLSI